jgi:chemotaxis protein methyltransferase CheR
MTSITADEFSALSKYIYAISGVALDSSKSYLIETRLKTMMQQHGCVSYMDLYNKAKADRSGDMEKEMVNAMTTNETLFFRDASPFEVFKHKILPDLVDARSRQFPGRPVPLRIWSAACSTGQEVYSIAISLRETLGNLSNFNISILGTDISDEAVTKASYGKYNKFEIERGLPSQVLNKYFTLQGDGWKIRDEIRAMAVFKKFNLMKPFAGLGKFDVVFCRNVAIYFTPGDKKMVFDKIASVLEPDGVLVIGSTESLTGVTNAFEPKRYLRSIFYQPSGAIGGATTPPVSARPVPVAPVAPSRPMPAPRPAPAAVPVSRPAPATAPVARPAVPSSEPPRPASAPTSIPTPAPAQIQPPVQPVEDPVPVSAVGPDAVPAAPATSPRPPLPRSQPTQVYRAGDKSSLKRLLLKKKQQA